MDIGANTGALAGTLSRVAARRHIAVLAVVRVAVGAVASAVMAVALRLSSRKVMAFPLGTCETAGGGASGTA